MFVSSFVRQKSLAVLPGRLCLKNDYGGGRRDAAAAGPLPDQLSDHRAMPLHEPALPVLLLCPTRLLLVSRDGGLARLNI